MLRIEIETVFAVRPNKGERRHHGMLLKCSVSKAADLAEALRILAAHRDGCEAGYSRVIAARIADDELWKAQLKAAPKVADFKPDHLAEFDMEAVDALIAPEDEAAAAAVAPLDPILAAQIDLFAEVA